MAFLDLFRLCSFSNLLKPFAAFRSLLQQFKAFCNLLQPFAAFFILSKSFAAFDSSLKPFEAFHSKGLLIEIFSLILRSFLGLGTFIYHLYFLNMGSHGTFDGARRLLLIIRARSEY